MSPHLTSRARAEFPGMIVQARSTICDMAHPKASHDAFCRGLVRADPDCSSFDDLVTKMLGVAVAPRIDPDDVAYLDIINDLENAGAFSPEEMTCLERETPRMRAPAGMMGSAARAHRFASFVNGRNEEGTLGEGLHIGVRRVFERLYKGFSGLQTLANRAGFQHAGDMFEPAYSRMSQRDLSPNMPGETMQK